MAAKAQGVPPFAAHLLDFIGDIEAPRGYDTVYGNNQGKLKKPVTQMTIAEVQAAQAGWTKQFGSSATGRYQFMRETLKGLIAEQNLDVSAKFDERMQDRLGFALLRRRGYDDFVAGKIGVTAFAKALAQEWASLPVLADTRGAHRELVRGQSYYAGDGLNKSLVSPERVEAALRVQLPGAGTVPATTGEIVKKAARDAGIAGGATGVGKAGETAVVDASLPWVEILIAAIVVAVLVFVVSFGWRWWKARQAATDSAVAADAAEADAGLDTPASPKRLSGADAAIADDLAASIASAAKARAAVAKSAEPRRKPKKRAAPKRRSAKSAKKRRRV